MSSIKVKCRWCSVYLLKAWGEGGKVCVCVCMGGGYDRERKNKE